jgi:hypothetical protein
MQARVLSILEEAGFEGAILEAVKVCTRFCRMVGRFKRSMEGMLPSCTGGWRRFSQKAARGEWKVVVKLVTRATL